MSVLLSYAGLFAVSFLAATALPLGSEVTLAALVGAGNQIIASVLVATSGNVLGACTTYWLGRKTAQTFACSREFTRKEARAARLFRRYGGPALLLSPLPVIGDALVVLAGATRQSLDTFLFWVTLGKATRYAAVAWAVTSL